MNICASSWQDKSFFLFKRRRVHHHAERLQNHMLTFHPHTSIRLLRILRHPAAGASRSGRSDKTSSALRLLGLSRESIPEHRSDLQKPAKSYHTEEAYRILLKIFP